MHRTEDPRLSLVSNKRQFMVIRRPNDYSQTMLQVHDFEMRLLSEREWTEYGRYLDVDPFASVLYVGAGSLVTHRAVLPYLRTFEKLVTPSAFATSWFQGERKLSYNFAGTLEIGHQSRVVLETILNEALGCYFVVYLCKALDPPEDPDSDRFLWGISSYCLTTGVLLDDVNYRDAVGVHKEVHFYDILSQRMLLTAMGEDIVVKLFSLRNHRPTFVSHFSVSGFPMALTPWHVVVGGHDGNVTIYSHEGRILNTAVLPDNPFSAQGLKSDAISMIMYRPNPSRLELYDFSA